MPAMTRMSGRLSSPQAVMAAGVGSVATLVIARPWEAKIRIASGRSLTRCSGSTWKPGRIGSSTEVTPRTWIKRASSGSGIVRHGLRNTEKETACDIIPSLSTKIIRKRFLRHLDRHREALERRDLHLVGRLDRPCRALHLLPE